eukprot:365183-Chlamydomonas_euryale.AAC.6
MSTSPPCKRVSNRCTDVPRSPRPPTTYCRKEGGAPFTSFVGNPLMSAARDVVVTMPARPAFEPQGHVSSGPVRLVVTVASSEQVGHTCPRMGLHAPPCILCDFVHPMHLRGFVHPHAFYGTLCTPVHSMGLCAPLALHGGFVHPGACVGRHATYCMRLAACIPMHAWGVMQPSACV